MGIHLQNFRRPLSLFLTRRDKRVRRLLLIGPGSYLVRRIRSGLFFIREMLAFQKIPDWRAIEGCQTCRTRDSRLTLDFAPECRIQL